MCYDVIINNGEKEIETPIEFLEHFGFMPPMWESGYGGMVSFELLDCCLCPFDVEKGLKDHNIAYTVDCGDIYVTENK